MQLAVFFLFVSFTYVHKVQALVVLGGKRGPTMLFCAPLNLILTTGLCLSASLWW